jgi:putative transposase
MDVSEAKRLKALEDENRKLKKLLAESMLDAATRFLPVGKFLPKSTIPPAHQER